MPFLPLPDYSSTDIRAIGASEAAKNATTIQIWRSGSFHPPSLIKRMKTYAGLAPLNRNRRSRSAPSGQRQAYDLNNSKRVEYCYLIAQQITLQKNWNCSFPQPV